MYNGWYTVSVVCGPSQRGITGEESRSKNRCSHQPVITNGDQHITDPVVGGGRFRSWGGRSPLLLFTSATGRGDGLLNRVVNRFWFHDVFYSATLHFWFFFGGRDLRSAKVLSLSNKGHTHTHTHNGSTPTDLCVCILVFVNKRSFNCFKFDQS